MVAGVDPEFQAVGVERVPAPNRRRRRARVTREQVRDSAARAGRD